MYLAWVGSKTHNKFAKIATFASLTARDAFVNAPLGMALYLFVSFKCEVNDPIF